MGAIISGENYTIKENGGGVDLLSFFPGETQQPTEIVSRFKLAL